MLYKYASDILAETPNLSTVINSMLCDSGDCLDDVHAKLKVRSGMLQEAMMNLTFEKDCLELEQKIATKVRKRN